MKARLLYRSLMDFVEHGDYHVALIAGIRRTGKTTLLKQLREKYGTDAEYFDLSKGGDIFNEIEDVVHSGKRSLLLLDEIGYLDDYEQYAQLLFNLTSGEHCQKFKVIMTGSSPAHIIKLANSKLGGGRAKLFRLPLLTFVEYLYFTNKITSYDDYNSVKAKDFANYLRLVGIEDSSASDLAVSFDDRYFDSFYAENEISNRCSYLANSITSLESDDLTNLVHLMAYKLNEACSWDKMLKPAVGRQEQIHLSNAGIKTRLASVDLSESMLSTAIDEALGISWKSKARVLYFLLYSGLANIGYTRDDLGSSQADVGIVMLSLQRCENESDLRELFKSVSICMNSPLFYTQIGDDILKRMNVPVEMLNKGMLFGKMLEIYMRGALALYSERGILTSTKLQYSNLGEVDLVDPLNWLLCEISSHNKKVDEIHVGSYFKDNDFIRICSSESKDFFSEAHQFYQIPYAKLCCMLDTGDIFKLKKTKIKPQLANGEGNATVKRGDWF